MKHPHIFLTADEHPKLRSVAAVKTAIKTGHSQMIWRWLLEKTAAELGTEPLLPTSVFPGRNLNAAKHANPDYTVCRAAGGRVLRSALATLLTDDLKWKSVALSQMEALFNPKLWPEWMDQAHKRFGYQADLRTGMLSLDLALAYDWLYPHLSNSERQFILEGLDRCGIQPYLSSLKQNPWWAQKMNNWLTVIVGGLGIAGMALGTDHPDSQKLVDFSFPLMQKYLTAYGPEGEFNESVDYSNATQMPVAYFLAYWYASKGEQNQLSQPPFLDTCYWGMYFTLPPGRYAAFGDSGTEQAPLVKYFAAVAAANQDEVIQWYYRKHSQESDDPLELLWYDARIETTSPEGVLPRGRAYAAYGANISSRTSWDARSTDCVVYGKAGREANHEHNDAGQLCIDGFGERLIVDLGSPSGYPADFFSSNRWKYYNASVLGHNILQFDRQEQRPRNDAADSPAAAAGKMTGFDFADDRGGYWQIDLTAVYENTTRVRRTVVHLHPGIVVVLDEADLPQPGHISLRWHTIVPSEPDAAGNFVVTGEKAQLIGRIHAFSPENIGLTRKQHHYSPPYHLERTGEPLVQRNESYIDCEVRADGCRWVSLFAVKAAGKSNEFWQKIPQGFGLQTNEGLVRVIIDDEKLQVKNEATGNYQEVPL